MSDRPILPETREWLPIETAPKDGTILYTPIPIKWMPYKRGSEQFRRGIKGRWMESNGYGGWRPCQYGEPAYWLPLDLPSPPESGDA